jgi:hypothetical protein
MSDTNAARVRGAVARSTRVLAVAESNLQRHQRWLENHNAILFADIKAYQRLCNRRRVFLATKRAAISAILFVPSTCLALLCKTFQLCASSFARKVFSVKPPRLTSSRTSAVPPERRFKVPSRVSKELLLAKPHRAENQKWPRASEAFQGGLPQHNSPSRLGSLRDAAQAWSPDLVKSRQAKAERKSPRAYSVISSRIEMVPASGRLRRVFVPAFGLCALVLVATAAIRAIDPATPAVALIPIPGPEKAVQIPPSKTTKISRPPTTSGFTIIVDASLGEALPVIAQDVPGIIRMATPLPPPARAEGFTILTNLSLPAPLQPFPRTVADFMAITRPLDQAAEPVGDSKAAASAAATLSKGKLKPKKKLAAPVSRRTQPRGALPWLTLPNFARW